MLGINADACEALAALSVEVEPASRGEWLGEFRDCDKIEYDRVIAGVFEAQYFCLRKHPHSPSAASTETVEELTQSLMPRPAPGARRSKETTAALSPDRKAQVSR